MFTINSVTLGGNLTADPELRSTPNGNSVCKVRLAVNARRKDGSGNWVDKPNFFNVTIWGKLGENVAQNLHKGSKLAVQGRLDWREWDATDGSGKRQAIDVIAEACFFDRQNGASASEGDVSPDTEGMGGSTSPPNDDDIPFVRKPLPDREHRRRDLFTGDRWIA